MTMITAGKVSEGVKVDQALTPRSLAATSATGRYLSMEKTARAMVSFAAGALAAGETVAAQLFEAQDVDGTGAQALSGATATITANVGANVMTATASTIAATDTIVVNGTTFTAVSGAAVAADGEFDVSGGDTAAMANFAAVVNQLLDGTVRATSAAAVATLTAVDGGGASLTITETGGNVTLATVEAQGYVDLEATALSDGFTHFACELTTSGTTDVAATCQRHQDYQPSQQAAASA